MNDCKRCTNWLRCSYHCCCLSTPRAFHRARSSQSSPSKIWSDISGGAGILYRLVEASRLNAVRGEVECQCVQVGVRAVVQAPEEGERAEDEVPDEVLEVEAAAEVGVGGEGGGGEE